MALLLAFVGPLARTAHAIQLKWSSGTTDVSFSSDTLCTLVLQADSAEVKLPGSWRLQWTADSSDVQITSLDPTLACLVDTAKVYSVVPPSTPADSAANQTTAYFCSAGSSMAAAAYFILDLADGSHGRLRVVALNPADTTQVIESNEVTFNGGIDGDFAPVILSASRSHISSNLLVNAVGADLDNAPMVQIAAPDTSWCLPLNVTERTATSLTATAQVAADLPTFVLQVGVASSGAMDVAPLAADTASVLSVRPACVDYVRETNLITQERIQPKDFAIVAARDSFHVFYIRDDQNLPSDSTERIIGHLRSRDLYHWFPTENTMTAIHIRPNRWDNFHVWAPTIVKRPNDITYHMLYTGVQLDASGHQIQRIGHATSNDLNVWMQDTTWICEPKNTDWAERDSTTIPGQQFRDPFVMEDPDSAGHYLMFLVGGSKERHPRMVVGAARTVGPKADFRKWYDVGALWNTDSLHTRASIVESPHAIADPSGRWAIYYSGQNPVDYAAIARGDSTTFGRDSNFVCLQTSGSNGLLGELLSDSTNWSAPDTLYKFLGYDQTLQSWHGSEYYTRTSGYEYLAAYDDNQQAIDISEVSWHDQHTYVLNDSCPVKVTLGIPAKGSRVEFALSLLGARPSQSPVRFAVQIPTKAWVRLAIYDLLGRRIRTLLDEELPPGRRELRWDGRGASGEAVGTGVYFARLTSAVGQRVERVVLLR